MNIELRWLASQSASCFHAADALRRQRSFLDAKVAAALAEPVRLLLQETRTRGLPEEDFFRHLVPLSASIENNRELAQVAIRKTSVSGPRAGLMTGALAGWMGDVEAAGQRAFPYTLDELLRLAKPLQSEWNRLGPTMLRRIGRLVDERLIVSRADVIVIYPVTGGGWETHLDYNSVRIEPGPIDSADGLPQIVRLAWLLAQLNVDIPIFSERIPRRRLPVIAALAMLPPVLTAAAGLELAECDLATIRRALDEWEIEVESSVDTAETVVDWWETYRASRPPVSVALPALDRMIFEPAPTTHAT